MDTCTPVFASPCRAVLGSFDGFHAGHRALFARARELCAGDGLALLAVVIRRGGDGRLSDGQTLHAMLSEAGADGVVELALEDIKGLTYKEFVLFLKEKCCARACVCGFNFRFGAGRAGSAQTLASLIPTDIVAELRLQGQTVSSSAVRALLAAGDVRRAAQLLSRPYSVSGEVTHGKALGRRMGAPTANIPLPEGACVPKHGVYLTRVTHGGSAHYAVTNVGVRPTVDGADVNVESWLFDFTGDLYGKPVTVEFLEYIRAEERFPSVAALEAQIALDRECAKELIIKESREG